MVHIIDHNGQIFINQYTKIEAGLLSSLILTN